MKVIGHKAKLVEAQMQVARMRSNGDKGAHVGPKSKKGYPVYSG